MTVEPRVQRLEKKAGELLEKHSARASSEELAKWADDPVGWDREAGRDPVDYQCEVMESVAENKRTAWRGCHASGKDFTIGSLAVWGAYARGMLVLVVSATEKQVMGQTMREVHRAWRAAREAHGIGGELFQGSVRIDGEDRIVALTGSANVDALTGWHDPENGVMVLISEGQGERLEEAAYDAAEGNVTTAKGRILAVGNPVRPFGRFHAIHQRSSWNQFRTSAFDTPNVKAGEQVRAGFPAPDFPEDKAQEFGEDSVWYVGRVLAEFPQEEQDGLIRRVWLDDAVERWKKGHLQQQAYEDREPYVLAVDVARKGRDCTVVAFRRGNVLERFESWRGADTEETTDRIHRIAREMGSVSPFDPDTSAVSKIVVDAVSVGGGVYDKLANRPGPWTVVEHKGSRKPDGFKNKRAESFWQLRMKLEEGEIALPEDQELFEELLSIRWRENSRGEVQLEAKRKLVDRLGRSPDKADALAMAFGRTRRKRVTRPIRWG